MQGRTATFCIETTDRTATNWGAALSNCNAINDSTHGRAHLCTMLEWRTACDRGTGLTNMTNDYEWVAEYGYYAWVDSEHLSQNATIAFAVGSGTCGAISQSARTTNMTYRCCLR